MTSVIDERLGTGLGWACAVAAVVLLIAAMAIGIMLSEKDHTTAFIAALTVPFVLIALGCAGVTAAVMFGPDGDYVDHGFLHDRYVPSGFDDDVLTHQYGLIHIDSSQSSSDDKSTTYINKANEQFSSCHVIHRKINEHTMAVSRVVCDQKDRTMRPVNTR